MSRLDTADDVIIPPYAGTSPGAFGVRVHGRHVPVYAVAGFAGGAAQFATFAIRTGVDVEVDTYHSFDSVAVRPDSAGVAGRMTGAKSAAFRIEKPGKYYVQFNGEFNQPLYLWVYVPETDAPDPADPQVRYFGPGVHHADRITVASGQRVHLSDGAWVHGWIEIADAHDVIVSGRGVLCQGNYAWKPTNGMGPPVGIQRSRNVVIRDISIIDSNGWTCVMWDCDHVLIDAINILAERLYSTDGINPCNSRDVTIRSCFIRTKDDCVSVKGADYHGPSDHLHVRNILVEGCVLWSENNNVLVLGSETRVASIDNVVFRDCDVLHHVNTCGDEAGVMAIIVLHDTQISNVRFEDIRVEHTTAPLFNFFITNGIFGIPSLRRAGGCTVSGILVKDITVTGPALRRSFLRGLSANEHFAGVRFENISLHGTLARSLADLRLQVGDGVLDVTIG